jgi:hypothetical protein
MGAPAGERVQESAQGNFKFVGGGRSGNALLQQQAVLSGWQHEVVGVSRGALAGHAQRVQQQVVGLACACWQLAYLGFEHQVAAPGGAPGFRRARSM